MYQKKIEGKIFDKHPKTFTAEYPYSPNQIVLLRFYEPTENQKPFRLEYRNYIDTPVVIREISFDQPSGSHAPVCRVELYNTSNKGEISGCIDLFIVVHRYESPMYLQPHHINFFAEHQDRESFFIVLNGFKLYPFRKE
jgi:hypothetical protein